MNKRDKFAAAYPRCFVSACAFGSVLVRGRIPLSCASRIQDGTVARCDACLRFLIRLWCAITARSCDVHRLPARMRGMCISRRASVLESSLLRPCLPVTSSPSCFIATRCRRSIAQAGPPVGRRRGGDMKSTFTFGPTWPLHDQFPDQQLTMRGTVASARSFRARWVSAGNCPLHVPMGVGPSLSFPHWPACHDGNGTSESRPLSGLIVQSVRPLYEYSHSHRGPYNVKLNGPRQGFAALALGRAVCTTAALRFVSPSDISTMSMDLANRLDLMMLARNDSVGGSVALQARFAGCAICSWFPQHIKAACSACSTGPYVSTPTTRPR